MNLVEDDGGFLCFQSCVVINWCFTVTRHLIDLGCQKGRTCFGSQFPKTLSGWWSRLVMYVGACGSLHSSHSRRHFLFRVWSLPSTPFVTCVCQPDSMSWILLPPQRNPLAGQMCILWRILDSDRSCWEEEPPSSLSNHRRLTQGLFKKWFSVTHPCHNSF